MGENLETLQRFLALCQAGDMKRACQQFLTEDFECHEPPGLPQQGIFRGRDAPLRITEIYRGIWDVSIDDTQLWEAGNGDVIVARYVMTWTSRQTGRSMTEPVLETNHFRDGKIARMEIFHFDPIGLLAILDVDR